MIATQAIEPDMYSLTTGIFDMNYGIRLGTELRTDDTAELIGTYGAYYVIKQRKLIPELLWVEPQYRGHRFGELMMRSLVEKGIEVGAHTINGHVESQYSLAIKSHLFDSEAMRFYVDANDTNGLGGSRTQLPATYDQIYDSLVHAQDFEANLEDRQHGVYVQVDLKDYRPIGVT